MNNAAFREKCRARMMGNRLRRGKKMPEEAKRAISLSLAGNKYRTGIPHPEAERRRVSMRMLLVHDTGKHPKTQPYLPRNHLMAHARATGATYREIGRAFDVSASAASRAVNHLHARREKLACE